MWGGVCTVCFRVKKLKAVRILLEHRKCSKCFKFGLVFLMKASAQTCTDSHPHLAQAATPLLALHSHSQSDAMRRFFPFKTNNLEVTSATHTHTERTCTHYATHCLTDRDRPTDVWWDRHEDTADLKPWLSTQEVGRKERRCRTNQRRDGLFF